MTRMKREGYVAAKWLGCLLVSVLVALLSFFSVAILPLTVEMMIHGPTSVYHSPGHGGAAVLFAIPFAGLAAVVMFLLTLRSLRRRFSR